MAVSICPTCLEEFEFKDGDDDDLREQIVRHHQEKHGVTMEAMIPQGES